VIINIGKALDVMDYLKKTNMRYYLLFALCFETGMVLDEVLSLKVSGLRNKSSLMISNIEVKLRRELREEIKTYCKDKEKNEYVFQSSDGFNQKLGKKRAILILAEAVGLYGIEDFGVDTLRKSFGYLFYLSTRNLELLKQLFGHTEEYDTLKYIELKGVIDENSISD